eukprot:NODE_3183_length_1406_cov_11.389712_g2767_i0.p1 GENE.NODE_3183_length_1406_cov_11.389712_g2767_i0~~NODE_3183_length_1406_cov_11.389712_g2767_i0.p1  ORF type:complete len:347 (-),score=52.94 NODE_3183_length_1406_cov_11.389712_g2767_i0:121-1161(-)
MLSRFFKTFYEFLKTKEDEKFDNKEEVMELFKEILSKNLLLHITYDRPSETIRFSSSRPLLIVLDIDSLLVDRHHCRKIHRFLEEHPEAEHTESREFVYRRRPHLDEFISYLRAHKDDFKLMTWSSAKRQNASQIAYVVFDEEELLTCWGREDCEHYYYETINDIQAARSKATPGEDIAGIHYALTRKNLSRIWESQSLGNWNERNTLLIDDDPRKASNQPENAIHPPPYSAKHFISLEEYDNDTGLLDIIKYLEGIKSSHDVREYVKEHPFVVSNPRTEVPASPITPPSRNSEQWGSNNHRWDGKRGQYYGRSYGNRHYHNYNPYPHQRGHRYQNNQQGYYNNSY